MDGDGGPGKHSPADGSARAAVVSSCGGHYVPRAAVGRLLSAAGRLVTPRTPCTHRVAGQRVVVADTLACRWCCGGVEQFADIQALHLHFVALHQHPADYCVTGEGLDAQATTSVNDCYITAKENWELVQSYVQPCYSPTGSLATMEACSRRNENEGYFAMDWDKPGYQQWAPGYTGPDSPAIPAP